MSTYFKLGLAAYNHKDYINALDSFNRAALEGHAGAQEFIGHLYYSGWGVDQDVAAAAHWYELAAAKGSEYAQSSIGVMYRDGEGVKQDCEKAVYWHTLAAEC